MRLAFDPGIINLDLILEVFFRAHNPTSYNKQGSDVGTQYRSVIFFENDKQKKAIDTMIKRVSDENWWGSAPVTEVEKLTSFFPAESYHQNYYNKNEQAPYCQVMIAPKLEKLSKYFVN